MKLKALAINFGIAVLFLSMFFGIFSGMMYTATIVAEHFDSILAGLAVWIIPLAAIVAIMSTAEEKIDE